MDHWAYPGVKVIRSLGLLDGGYSNDYRLDEPMGKWRLQNMINNSLKKTGREFALVEDITDPVTNGNMIAVAARLADVHADTYEAQLNGLQEKGILTEEILSHLGAETETPLAAEAIMIVANLYQYYLAM